jgi:putative tricarboxylic transport membrane protein
VLVPLLTLGFAYAATAQCFLVAFQQYGLQPGPLLFENSLSWFGPHSKPYIGNVMLLV